MIGPITLRVEYIGCSLASPEELEGPVEEGDILVILDAVITIEPTPEIVEVDKSVVLAQEVLVFDSRDLASVATALASSDAPATGLPTPVTL